MAVGIVPPSRNGAEQALMALYWKTEQKLIAEIIRKRQSNYVDYAETAALERVRRILQKMIDDSAEYVPLMIEKEFYPGKRLAYKSARDLVSAERTLIMEQLTDNLLGEVVDMARTAYQSTAEKLYLLGRKDTDIFRERGLESAMETTAAGRGSMTTVEEFVRNLNRDGITAFVDKSGREWSLHNYGNMAVRTTARQAQVSSMLTRDDHDLYKILPHFASCRLCASYEGRIYSKSGTDPNYPPLSAAFGKIEPGGGDDLSNTYLNIHPNCLHTLTAWTEKGKTEEEIQKARDRSSFEKNPTTIDPRSKKSIEAYREKERNRRRLLEDIKQWEKYREAGVPGIPKTFQTFRKHKEAGDDKYNGWLNGYRNRGKR